MATIFRKTDKGQAEIETRAHKLPPRLRSALILVDGKRSDEELRKLVLGEPEATLDALAQQGFIEVVAAADRPPQRLNGAAAASAAPAPHGPGSPPAAPAAAAMSRAGFEQLKRDAVRALTDAVGPMGEALALKIERAAAPAELRASLELARQVIANTRGGNAAQAFDARFLAALH